LISYTSTSVVLMGFTIKSPPYWSWKANSLQFAAYFTALWTNIMAIVVSLSENTFLTTVIYFSTAIPLFFFAVACGWLIYHPRSKPKLPPKTVQPSPDPDSIQLGILSDEHEPEVLTAVEEKEPLLFCLERKSCECFCFTYVHGAGLVLCALMLWFGVVCRTGGCFSIPPLTGSVVFGVALAMFGLCISFPFLVICSRTPEKKIWLATSLMAVIGIILLSVGSICYTGSSFALSHCNQTAGLVVLIIGAIEFCSGFCVSFACLCLSCCIDEDFHDGG